MKMGLKTKFMLLVFAVSVVCSTFVISYSMNVFRIVYNYPLGVSIQSITLTNSSANTYDVTATLLIENQAEFTLRLLSVERLTLYLNGSYVGSSTPKSFHYNSPLLENGVPTAINITIADVSKSRIENGSSEWYFDVVIWVHDFPLSPKPVRIRRSSI